MDAAARHQSIEVQARVAGALWALSVHDEIADKIGALGGIFLAFIYRAMTWQRMRESVYLTVRTTAMVCWLFVGSYTFSAVFSYLGGEHVISEFVQSLNLSPIMFLILAQLIIFLLGWPLEWSEIIIIFVPIFLPLLCVILSMVLMYVFPQIVFYLPEVFYGR